MRLLSTAKIRSGTVGALLGYLWKERLWWMIPFVITLVVVGTMLIVAQSSPILPFIYTAF